MIEATNNRTRIFCALDSGDIENVRSLAQAITGAVDGLKLGLEFFYRPWARRHPRDRQTRIANISRCEAA